jgi:V-type H+-transporting ATPase subunit H
MQKDLAAHILSQLIEAHEYKNCEEQARQFLNWLLEQRDKMQLSTHAYTFCLMYLLKTNELASEFERSGGFTVFSKLLDSTCTEDHQVAYNVVCALWITSFHPFALKRFEDYNLEIIERAVKVLDYFNKEKIVRVVLLLLDNLKQNEGCHEIMSDIGVIGTVIKLQNRHWVDADINELLEKLFEYLDQNQKQFSSIDKFKKEILSRRPLRWGPIHTDKFWQENFIYFHDTDNLNLIKVLEEYVQDVNLDDRTKAIALFDLGEFARFFPMGRTILENDGVKADIIKVMGRVGSSAELKKEAITCYQKLLMNSWSSQDFKV